MTDDEKRKQYKRDHYLKNKDTYLRRNKEKKKD